MPNQFEPFDIKVRNNTLAEKLLNKSEQELERLPQGFVIVDQQERLSNLGLGCMILFGLSLTGLGLLIGIAHAFNFITLLTQFINAGFSTINIMDLLTSSFFIVFTFALIGSGMIGISNAFERRHIAKYLEASKLTFPRYPWRLGETLTVTFRRDFKPGYKAKIEGKLLARLICLEVYMDNRGSGSPSYFGEPVWFQDLPSLDIPANTSKIEIDWLIRIPKNGVPTIKFQNNAVLWGIDVCLYCPNFIRDYSVFHLLVEPEVI